MIASSVKKTYLFLKQKILDFIYPPQRFLRYIICGCGAAAINYSGFLFFYSFCKLHFSLAMFFATILTWIYSFFANKFFVFEAKTGKTLKESIFFVTQQIILFGVSNLLMWIGISIFAIPAAISWLIVAALIVLINFAGMKFLIWRNKSDRSHVVL